MLSHVLLINCSDQRGLVYKITGVLYKHEVNIISNGEFVERNFNYFFMRTEFSGEFDRERLLQDLYEALPETVEIRLTDKRKKNIVLMATKEHHCLSDLLVRHAFNELDATILCVISNYDTLQELTAKFNIPFHCISHEGISREEHEKQILELVQQYRPEFVVLAKYMRILSADFVSCYSNRIINIHHSFLPAFVGANPYAQAYERGVKIIGATAHFVNDQLDEGPIIAQNVIPVAHTHSAREMAQAGRDVEKIVLAKSLKLVLNEQVFVYKNKTIIFE
ncbi:formyltetrahydrofolate deformylase [Pontibacter sp. SGAir0037]|uniref:formyltetrahydrofolate deformylase n=1 Tax=Pontibacter sp. SGAir0037 TaxID=2571030 RepID=UPI0010CCB5C4|nr:formyltetrahydrofolate deformylase [Pontibacter sp. SGAir0037]QCR22046.1 formyltetrahydrofolate deformylase [Pontibacter sp. SGAir0037]